MKNRKSLSATLNYGGQRCILCGDIFRRDTEVCGDGHTRAENQDLLERVSRGEVILTAAQKANLSAANYGRSRQPAA